MKYLIVTMPDNTRWRIPAKFIAEHRAKHFVKHDGDPGIFNDEVAYCLGDDYEIEDWAVNSMNWPDFEAIVESLSTIEHEYNYQKCWPSSADKKVVEMK